MEIDFIWPILQEIDSLWLSISAISILFIFFFVKVKFQKQATIKSYAILFTLLPSTVFLQSLIFY
jgi:hypothetical protein